jgi:hypothetical protein
VPFGVGVNRSVTYCIRDVLASRTAAKRVALTAHTSLVDRRQAYRANVVDANTSCASGRKGCVPAAIALMLSIFMTTGEADNDLGFRATSHRKSRLLTANGVTLRMSTRFGKTD